MDSPMTGGYHRTIYPNRSLNRSGAVCLAVFLALAALLLAIGAIVIGAWPIVLFILVEAAGACCVARWLSKHQFDHESVRVDEVDVDIVRRVADDITRTHFPRGWARVSVVRGDALHPPRVLIGSHGRSVEVGTALTSEDRTRLADELRRAIRVG